MLVDETKSNVLSISAQCQILKLPRSVYYEKRSYTISDEEKERKAALKEEHNKHLDKVLIEWTNYSTYGYIKMSKHLLREGHSWATEHAIRMIYKELGLKGLTPVFKTTHPAKGKYTKYPYLLRNRKIRYVNEVWATDITYIKLEDCMVYFTAIIDLYSRKILAWRLSETMNVEFCLDALMEAIIKYGIPAIFNTDAGSQYTSKEFTSFLESYGILISMDGIGRCLDNVRVERTWRTLKYEWVFLRDYHEFDQLQQSLNEFVYYFNHERIHQSLDYQTPDEVYELGTFPNINIEEVA